MLGASGKLPRMVAVFPGGFLRLLYLMRVVSAEVRGTDLLHQRALGIHHEGYLLFTKKERVLSVDMAKCVPGTH
jgi:hypothetical protein